MMVAGSLLLAGCSSQQKSEGRYSIKQDRAPDRKVDLSNVPDAVPRVENKSRGGNKSPYTVWGKQYYVMNSAIGYQETGTASWYGKKFHGHKTSNGETYDMYAMSAAHKSLPLPTFAKVTNLANGKSVVVRVNDRGPFHGSRLIDLSYAAAYKLDMLRKGTAKVHVEAITPGQPSIVKKAAATQVVTQQVATQQVKPQPVPEPEIQPNHTPGKYIQVGAYSSWVSAQSVKSQIQRLIPDLSTIINKRDGTNPVYRVQIGPVGQLETLNGIYRVLDTAGFGQGHLVDLP